MDTITMPRPTKEAPSLEKALHALERMTLAGETVTREAIVKEAGVGEGTAQKAMALHRVKSGELAPEDIVLSASAQKKYDAKVRLFRKALDYEVETKARELHRQWREEHSLPVYFDKLKEVEDLLNSPRWAVMPTAHFKLILACLHPDNAREGTRNASRKPSPSSTATSSSWSTCRWTRKRKTAASASKPGACHCRVPSRKCSPASVRRGPDDHWNRSRQRQRSLRRSG